MYRKSRTSKPYPDHRVYSYFLWGLEIARANHVLTADIITCIPMAWGFCNLVAIKDWASRKVLTWRLLNTLNASFCLEALRAAIARYSAEVFNADQGSQFTSKAFTEILQKQSINISIDGRGRWLDNAFIERRWKIVNYEDIYLEEYDSIGTARRGLKAYFGFDNSQRTRKTLVRRTPDACFSAQPYMQVAA